jgi:glyoxylase-like metal-dependent hydrolase (beta-lactamase superfamily II)
VIPFVRDFDFDYAKPEWVTPLIRRIVARNPGPFTYTGTGTYIIGPSDPGAEVFLIDPGPEIEEHLDAILDAVKDQRLSHIFITHAHMDHSPLSRELSARTGAVIYAGREPCLPSEGEIRLEAGDDLDFCPDLPLNDGQSFQGTGFVLEAMANPGHTANHYGYILREENAFFPGDTVMGWSTTVISPPDGDMGDYMRTLRAIEARQFSTYWPTHGPAVTDTGPFIAAYIAHRQKREAQIMERLEASGPARILDMVPDLYSDIDKKLYPAAAHSMLAHLIDLTRRGEVVCSSGEACIKGIYSRASQLVTA